MSTIYKTTQTKFGEVFSYYGPMVVWGDGDPDSMPLDAAKHYEIPGLVNGVRAVVDLTIGASHEVVEGWWGRWGSFNPYSPQGSWCGPHDTIAEAMDAAIQDFEGSGAEP